MASRSRARSSTTRAAGQRHRSAKTARSKKPKAFDADSIPPVGPGERVWVLDLDWGQRIPGARWVAPWKVTVWVGATPPPLVEANLCGDYTYGRFVEDQMNAHHARPARPARRDRTMTPRPMQVEGARTLVRAAAAGCPMSVLADDPGVGKTIESVLAAKAIAKLSGARTVLVVAARPAAITVLSWAQTIAAAGDDGLRWVVLPWDQIGKVTAHTWDLIIADEAQYVRHQTTKRWKAWAKVSGLTNARRRPAHQIMVTATPGHNPLELGYLAPLFAHATNTPLSAWVGADPDTFVQQLRTMGVHVVKGERGGWEWSSDPKARARDLAMVQGWMSGRDVATMVHREAPWGPVQITGMPVHMDATMRRQYDSDWGDFCREMELARRGSNVAKGRAALLRFRQKASVIRVAVTAEWVSEQVSRGRQVVVSVENIDTGAVPLWDALTQQGIRVARAYGSSANTNGIDIEAERRAFQTGACPVIITTRTEAISLHAGEDLGGGLRATTAPRVGVFHQARYSGLVGKQITGRTHRDHQRSPWTVMYLDGTVEADVSKLMIERYAASSEMIGGDTTALTKIAQLLRADWMPLDQLGDDKDST